jgi:hypothetical protein
VLAAGAPELAPFMADECLLAMPDMEGIDYTMKEYMKLVEKTRECVERLNSQGDSFISVVKAHIVGIVAGIGGFGPFRWIRV